MTGKKHASPGVELVAAASLIHESPTTAPRAPYLPRGGEIARNDVSISEDGQQVRLSEMFGEHDTLALHI